MKKIKLLLFVGLAILGIILILIGKFVFTGENIKNWSGFFMGFGSAAFVLGIGNFISAIVTSKVETEKITRLKNIAVNDERNIRIKEKVGAAINHVLLYVISAMILTLGFMGAELFIIIMLSSVLLLQAVLAIVLTEHYSKKM